LLVFSEAQRFLNIHAATYNQFNLQRHLTSRPHFKTLRTDAFSGWYALAIPA